MSAARGIEIIEDAACALGSWRHDESLQTKQFMAGVSSDVGCFSFHARKGLTTGEGGCIVTDDKTIALRVREASNFGISDAYNRSGIPSFDRFGFNFKMSDIQAAVGVAQMKRLDKMIDERRGIANNWTELIRKYRWEDNETLKGVKIIPPYEAPYCFHVYQSYVCRTDSREALMNLFLKNGMETGIGTYACHQHPIFAEFVQGQSFPVSEKLAREAWALPMFINLRIEEKDGELSLKG